MAQASVACRIWEEIATTRVDLSHRCCRWLCSSLPSHRSTLLLEDRVAATRSWLMARNRLLGFDRPIDRLGRGEFTVVREAAEAFVDGDYT